MTYTPVTIRDLVRAAANRLKRARIPEPRLEAESLLSHLLQRDRSWLMAHDDATLPKSSTKAYARMIAKRALRIPFAHIVGEQGFYGRMFTVTKDVLIPRPETELLVETVLARSGERELFLDVGTGSGAIGLTLLAERPKSKAILYDVSARARAVAKTNAKRLHLGRRARIEKIDIVKGPLKEPQKRPVIAANLPYLPFAAWKKTQPEIRVHEPRLALVSGKDGLDHYRALFARLACWNRPPRLLVLEAEPGQFKNLSRFAESAMPGAKIETLADLHGDERLLVAEYKNTP